MSQADAKKDLCQKLEATRDWLEKQESAEIVDFDVASVAESSVVDSSEESGTDKDENEVLTTMVLGTQIVSTEVSTITEGLKELFNSIPSVQTVGNINIENSTGVHIGNITNINGNIQIIHSGNSFRRKHKNINKNPINASKTSATNEHEECVSSEAFLDRIEFKIPKELLSIIPRSTWLAQQPMDDYEYLQEPVEYVIISHTATESSEIQAINIRSVRAIQCFHIESRGWEDIAYNFLVGCDGNIYEGRGWGVVGAHTLGYNTRAIGISFIGCFMRILPSKRALNAFKNLLERGVTKGHLVSNYKLLCHCQCRPTQSPGRKLFEEIQTWDHFYNIENEDK